MPRFSVEERSDGRDTGRRAIERRFLLLEAAPEIGRPLADGSELRELIIPFGDSGDVALYRYEEAENTVYALAVRHQREAGF